MAIVTLSHEGLHSFFYKNIVYKNIEAEICENKFKDKPHAETEKGHCFVCWKSVLNGKTSQQNEKT